MDDALDDRQERKGGRRRNEEVWSWGAGTHGQLACGTLVDALTPQRVDALSGASQPILAIACGGAHAIAVFGELKKFTNSSTKPPPALARHLSVSLWIYVAVRI